jgi:ubiquinone/menaquinone biosynthesis C-methylase UbiE
VEFWLFDTFVMRGRIGRLREEVIERAGLGPGARMLDVGCGTGTLAIRAAARVGDSGEVVGIDPAPRQIARAQAKARRSRRSPEFRQATVQDLPFPDGSFDAVTSTLMMHHLPAEVRDRALCEIRRVLKPGGRLVVADFDAGAADGHGTNGADGHHGDESSGAGLTEAGFSQVTSSHTDFGRSHHGWSGVTVTAALRS